VRCASSFFLLVYIHIFLMWKIFLTFDLSYISNTREVHCAHSVHGYSVPWTNSPAHYIPIVPLLLPPLQTAFGEFHYAVFIRISAVCFHPLHHSVSFPFPLLLPTHPPKNCPIIIIIIINRFRTRFHKWARTYNIWSFELDLYHSTR
jgi:hypothetical protein